MPQFFDTNILLYFASSDAGRADRVSDLLAEGGVISVQVLNEAARVMRGKWNYPWDRVHDALAAFRTVLEIVPLDLVIHRRGLDIAERYKINIFDSMIAAAALEAGCDILYSEDMHPGLVIGGRLRIVNPFAPAS